MIPVLFYPNTNVDEMESNGIGRLNDCIYCRCTEERNSIYELEFEYPIHGIHFDQIQIGRIVRAVPSEGEDPQPFIIYRRTATIAGTAVFYAFHYSYLLSYLVVPANPNTPSALYTAAEAMYNMWDWSYGNTLLPEFSFYTDITTKQRYTVSVPSSLKSLFAGQEGSILDLYGGEFYYDNTDVTLYQHRGQDNGVTIQYGKNLLQLDDTIDGSNLYDRVVPFWVDSSTGVVTEGAAYSSLSGVYWTEEIEQSPRPDPEITDENDTPIMFRNGPTRTVPLDLTDKFDTQPTSQQLQAAAIAYLEANTPWVPKRNIKVDFVALWQTEEYRDIADLERVKLCDTVKVVYPELLVVATAKVIKTVWNVLLDKYDSIEIGNISDDYGGYTGIIKTNGRTFRVINGQITSVK
jgi:phage minor structural protein